MLNKRDFEKFKEYLDSGTTNANITKVALISIALASLPIILVGASAMGNAVQIFKNANKKYKDKEISNTIAGLHRNKFIEYVNDSNNSKFIKITKKGQLKLKSLSLELITIKKPVIWDGKWRVVIFDLPIRYKNVRHSLRFKLKDLGFIQLQKSVWIHPYNCTDEIAFISNYFKVDKYVELMVVSEISSEIKLKKTFGLV